MIIKINKNQEGIRLDKFLFSKYKNSNIIDIQRFINKKEIKINGKKVEFKYLLKENDEITFNDFVEKVLKNPVKNEDIKNKQNKNVDEKYNRLITENIIFQDENILAINKPSGLSVQGGSGINVSVDKILKNLNGENTNLKLVHRLDRDTSGVLLIAKNIETANSLTNMFRTKESITKEYLLFVWGKPTNLKGTINLPLLKKYNNNAEKVYVDKKDGKEAITKYEVLDFSEKYNISLVKATILTGRTHQIRVHFKEIGCPVVGDFKYGGSQKNIGGNGNIENNRGNSKNKNNQNNNINSVNNDNNNNNKNNNSKINPEKKLLLHSWHTNLTLFKKQYDFVAELPEYMKKVEEMVGIDGKIGFVYK